MIAENNPAKTQVILFVSAQRNFFKK